MEARVLFQAEVSKQSANTSVSRKSEPVSTDDVPVKKSTWSALILVSFTVFLCGLVHHSKGKHKCSLQAVFAEVSVYFNACVYWRKCLPVSVFLGSCSYLQMKATTHHAGPCMPVTQWTSIFFPFLIDLRHSKQCDVKRFAIHFPKLADFTLGEVGGGYVQASGELARPCCLDRSDWVMVTGGTHLMIFPLTTLEKCAWIIRVQLEKRPDILHGSTNFVPLNIGLLCE